MDIKLAKELYSPLSLKNIMNKVNIEDENMPKYFNAPITMIWELTSRCSSNCIYCSGGFPYKSNNLNKSDKLKLADELINQQIFAINLSGGDPLLCDELEELVKKFTYNNIHVMICTPGLNSTDRIIKNLCKYPLVAFNLSLDSHISKINDYHRGIKNSIESVLKTIKLINKYSNKHCFIAIEAVVTKKNLKYIEEFIYFLIDYNISEIRLQPVIAMNKETYDNLSLSENQLDYFKNIVNRVNKKLSNYINMNNKYIYIHKIDQSLTIKRGYKTGINWGGTITPEGNLLLNNYLPFEFGNINDYGSFKNAWNFGFKIGWKHPEIKKILKEINSIKSLEDINKKYEFRKMHLNINDI